MVDVKQKMKNNYMNFVFLVFWTGMLIYHLNTYTIYRNINIISIIFMLLIYSLDIILSFTDIEETKKDTDKKYNEMLMMLLIVLIILSVTKYILHPETMNYKYYLQLIITVFIATIIIFIGKRIN